MLVHTKALAITIDTKLDIVYHNNIQFLCLLFISKDQTSLQ